MPKPASSPPFALIRINAALQKKVYGGAEEMTIAGLDEGTYSLAARAWYTEADGSWHATSFSQRETYGVAGVSQAPTVPILESQDQISNNIVASWSREGEVTEIFVYDAVGNFVLKQKVFGFSTEMTITGLNMGSYSLRARVWYTDEMGDWHETSFGPLEDFVVA